MLIGGGKFKKNGQKTSIPARDYSCLLLAFAGKLLLRWLASEHAKGPILP
jgi:lipid-A-disaccharide synthase-like uncharacterized protein